MSDLFWCDSLFVHLQIPLETARAQPFLSRPCDKIYSLPFSLMQLFRSSPHGSSHFHIHLSPTPTPSASPQPSLAATKMCETIVKQAALKEATDSEKLAILEAEISDSTQVIVDIFSRFLFETAFFEARENGYVTVEEIKSLMVDAQKQSYGDGLDENALHPYMWTWKSHYYGSNFYNFPYAFGLLFAKGLYAKYVEDTENFPEKYEQMLKVTGKMNIEQVTETIGIDVTKKEFWEASLKTITDDIEKFLELT